MEIINKAQWSIEKFPQRHLIVDNYSRDIIKMMFDIIEQGCTVNRLVAVLNVRRVSTPIEYSQTGFLFVSKKIRKMNGHIKW
ncbi:MAG: hypothetical protein R3Y54_10625 [Eubacteriales bacterium]